MTGLGLAEDYRKALADRICTIERALGRGSAKTFEDYKASCAEIKALEKSRDLFDDTIEKYLGESEQDDIKDDAVNV